MAKSPKKKPVDYNDRTLVDSTTVTLLSAFADFASQCISKDLAVSSGKQAALLDVRRRLVNKKAYELPVFDNLKDALESFLDEQVASMLRSRKLVRTLVELGQQVEKSEALDEGIRQLRQFRDEFFRGWPSGRAPSPVDHEAISKARDAIRRGEKGLSKDQIVWKGKQSEQEA